MNTPKQTIYTIIGLLVLIAFTIIGTSWYISSSADERYRELEIEKAVVEDKLNTSEEGKTKLLRDYRQLAEDQAEAEEARQQQMATLVGELRRARSEIGRLRTAVQEQQARIDRQIADVASTSDEQLAAEIQEILRRSHSASVFQHNEGEWFDTNRPGTEGIRASFLNLDKAEVTITGQQEEIRLFGEQITNLNDQITLREQSLTDCNARERLCSDTIASFEDRERLWEEAMRIRDDQIKALKQKGFWKSIKKYGTLAAVGIGAFEAGRRVGQP